jgi:hypothetical protein
MRRGEYAGGVVLMLSTRRPLPLITVMAAALAAATGLAPAASAGQGMNTLQATSPEVTGPVTKTVKTCRLYANETAFGMRCGTVTVDGSTIREILNGDPLPTCWHEPLPVGLSDEYGELEGQKEAHGDSGAYWLKTCLKGIDPETLRVHGKVTFTEEVVWVPDGAEVVGLTDNQRTLVAIEAREARIPLPTVATTPTVRPRVMRDVAFSVVNDVQAGPVSYSNGGTTVEMRARLVHLRIVPAQGASAVSCPGAGVEVTTGDTPTTRPEACWWRYARSSAAQPGRTYEVRAIASWTVEYSAGGAWTPLAMIEKQQVTLQPVTEVQTMVVP